MTDLILHREPPDAQAIALPAPRSGPISIRTATLDDFPFIDALQKQHSKMVGFFPRVWFESNIEKGKVLVAEEAALDSPSLAGRGSGGGSNGVSDEHASTIHVRPTHPPAPSLKGGGVSGSAHSPQPKAHSAAKPLAYCVFNDKYLKREELGIVYQLNVTPGRQRGLIGAALVKAAFERCPYGVKLFCCWCAQDLEANYFWESVGFVPIAFRTGSRPRLKKDGTISKPERMHIFWQRRIREGDEETPYWFPSETSGGAVRENRIVLPIPPGTHWSDAKPSVLPGCDRAAAGEEVAPLPLQPQPRGKRGRKAKSASTKLPGAQKPRRGLWFAPPPPSAEELKAAKEAEKKAKAEERKRLRKEKWKNDPKYVAAARELRDRYLEEVNTGTLLPPSACGKYDVSRELGAAPTEFTTRHAGHAPGTDRRFVAAEGTEVMQRKLLDAA